MRLNEPLFYSENICLGPIDHEKDAVIESRWSHDINFMRMCSFKPAVPLSAAQIRKQYEKTEKSQEESNNLFHFSIRRSGDERLIGIAEIKNIIWSNAAGEINLSIGEPEARRRGYGSEAARLLLRFAFDELNLHRLSVLIAEYNEVGKKFAEKFGFSVEVCRRQALERDGQYWNLYYYGLMQTEFMQSQNKNAYVKDSRQGTKL